MKRSKNAYGFLVGIILAIFSLFAGSCTKQLPHEGKVVFTQIPVSSISDNQLESHDFRYAPGMKIAIAEMDESLKNVETLTEDFHSARSPEISFNGKTIIFSGQKAGGDVWQIWQLDLEKIEIHQITQSDQNCTDPVWLPDGKVAYSKQIDGEKASLPDRQGLKYHALFSCYPDGSDEQRITFQPHEDVSASMLNDGRLLVSSRQVYPDTSSLKFLAIHPDGTKAELFYQTVSATKFISKAWESKDRRVFFMESNKLVSINFNRPLNSRKLVSAENQGIYLSIFPMDESQAIVSVKKPAERTFGLSIIDPSNPGTQTFYFNNSEYHLIEPVIVMSRSVPKKLPSTVNMERESGYFICMDTDQSEINIGEESSVKVQVLGVDKVLGEAPVEEDGSFYLEIGADQPIRFQTLNEAGEVVREPSSWMWVRPNERRGCVGCHEDREIAPENVVPLAIEKLPVAMIK